MGNQHNSKKHRLNNNYKIEKTHEDNEYPTGVKIQKSSKLQTYYHSASYYFNPYHYEEINGDLNGFKELSVVTNVLNQNVKTLFNIISAFTNLQTLTLKFGPCNYLVNNDIIELSDQIRVFNNLVNLEIDFSSNFKLDKITNTLSTNLGVAKLAKTISEFQLLNCLHLNFESCHLKDESLSEMLDGLYSSQIKCLKLNLSQSSVGAKSGYSLAILLNNQENKIEELYLKIMMTKIKEKFLEEFFKFIKIDKFKLKIFDICVGSCDLRNSIIGESMLGNFLKLNQSIEQFSLNIQNNQADDEEINSFISALCSHTIIKKLNLNFSNNNIKKVSTLENIGKNLLKMDKLTHLNLQLESLNLTMPKEILQTISYSKYLHTLQLFLSQNVISKQFIDSLLEVFSQDFISLKVLEIDIGQKSIDQISDHLANFIKCLNSSKSLDLQVLKLYFPTRNASPQILEENLKQMKVSIHTLHLKVVQSLFPAIMRGLQNSNVSELFIQDYKSMTTFNDREVVQAFIGLVAQNESLTKLYIKGTESSYMQLSNELMDQFNWSLYQSHKLVDCSLIKNEVGNDKLESLESYKIIIERRSIFCLVVAFINNCVDQIPVNPFHVFWDLYID